MDVFPFKPLYFSPPKAGKAAEQPKEKGFLAGSLKDFCKLLGRQYSDRGASLYLFDFGDRVFTTPFSLNGVAEER
jgi:hypothetical protein